MTWLTRFIANTYIYMLLRFLFCKEYQAKWPNHNRLLPYTSFHGLESTIFLAASYIDNKRIIHTPISSGNSLISILRIQSIHVTFTSVFIYLFIFIIKNLGVWFDRAKILFSKKKKKKRWVFIKYGNVHIS